jgi:hypothetical protein
MFYINDIFRKFVLKSLSIMTQLTLNIKESKVQFFLELIKNFDFIKIESISDQEIKNNIRQGYKEIQLIEQGKMKSTS